MSQTQVAEAGFFQQALDTQNPCQLVQIVVANPALYPQVSGSRHRIAIRFYASAEDKKAQQAQGNIDFELRCCTL